MRDWSGGRSGLVALVESVVEVQQMGTPRGTSSRRGGPSVEKLEPAKATHHDERRSLWNQSMWASTCTGAGR